MQINVISGEDVQWAGIEIGVRTDDGTHIKFGGAYDQDGQETAAYGDVENGKWMNVELSINSALVTDNAKEVPTLYIRLMKANMEYLLDNVTLVPVGTDAVSETEVSIMSVFGAKGNIRLELDKDTQISVYTPGGQKVVEQLFPQGEHSVSLPTGIYIVNKHKVVVY